MRFNFVTLLSLCILIAGVAARAYEPGKYAFGFDQIQIVTNAEKIAQGDVTLVGPRTGPADMFTGPLIYYIAAGWNTVVASPWVLVYTALTTATISGVVLFLLTKRYFSENMAALFLIIWAFSPLLIKFDRVVWNPNLTLLAATLVFFPVAAHLSGRKLLKSDVLFIFCGVFLGFQAHFSGLFLFPFLIAAQVLFRKLHLPSLIAGGLGLISTLLPTLIFDLRNNWLNLRGLQSFLSNRDEVHSSLQFFRLTDALQITILNIGRVVGVHLDERVQFFIGLSVLLGAVLLIGRAVQQFKVGQSLKSLDRTALLAVLWLALVAVGISFYSSRPPEYYFFIHVPAVLFLWVYVSSHVFRKLTPQVLATLCIFGAVHTTLALPLFNETSLLSIGNQLQLSLDLAKRNQEYPVAAVVYDMQPVDALGVQYFIERNLTLAAEGSIAHVITNAPVSERYNRLGVWFDPRVNPEEQYITDQDIILSTPKNVSLFRDYYQGATFGPHRVFQVVSDGTLTGDRVVVVDAVTDPFNPESRTVTAFKQSSMPIFGVEGWEWATYNGVSGFARHAETYSLLYVPAKLDEPAALPIPVLSAVSLQPKPLY